jgi:azurin
MYSLLLILTAIFVIGILTLLGGKVSNVFSSINSGLDARVLNISTPGESILYAPTALSATAGQQAKVTFKNGSAAQKHNWVLIKGGDDVAQKVDDAGAAAGEAAGYIPTDPNIIASVKLLNGNETGTASFTAPAAGTYTFLCTFPGHYIAGMHGTLTVK